MAEEDDRPPWDEDFAAELVGATILVGFTRLAHSGETKSREQFHGRIVSADRVQGICIAWQGEHLGGHYWLPPVTSAIQRMPPGKYELMTTGEVVENPGFMTTWTITEPPPDWKPEDEADDLGGGKTRR